MLFTYRRTTSFVAFVFSFFILVNTATRAEGPDELSDATSTTFQVDGQAGLTAPSPGLLEQLPIAAFIPLNVSLAFAMSLQFSGAFDLYGTDALEALIYKYANGGLKGRLSELNKVVKDEAKGTEPIVVITQRVHENSLKAVEFANKTFQETGMPFKFNPVIDNTLRDPFQPDQTNPAKRKIHILSQALRYAVGPLMIGISLLTDHSGNALSAPKLTAATVQTGYEGQFATNYIDRNFWTPIWKWGAKYRVAGQNPAILAVNLAYGSSLLAIIRGVAHLSGSDPAAFHIPDWTPGLIATSLGGLFFTVTYGRFQDDTTQLREIGKIDENGRYDIKGQSSMAFVANFGRLASIFLPLTFFALKYHGANVFEFGLGETVLAGLFVFRSLPFALKTSFGPRYRNRLSEKLLLGERVSLCDRALAKITNLVNFKK